MLQCYTDSFPKSSQLTSYILIRKCLNLFVLYEFCQLTQELPDVIARQPASYNYIAILILCLCATQILQSQLCYKVLLNKPFYNPTPGVAIVSVTIIKYYNGKALQQLAVWEAIKCTTCEVMSSGCLYIFPSRFNWLVLTWIRLVYIRYITCTM